jgi:hypothetical protein
VRIEHSDGWSRAVRTGSLKVQTPFTSNVLTKVEAAPRPSALRREPAQPGRAGGVDERGVT